MRSSPGKGVSILPLKKYVTPLRHVEGDLLAFLEGLEALHLDRGEMREEVFAAVVGRDEPVTLRVIEPLHSSGCHAIACLLLNGWSPAHCSDPGPARLTIRRCEMLETKL